MRFLPVAIGLAAAGSAAAAVPQNLHPFATPAAPRAGRSAGDQAMPSSAPTPTAMIGHCDPATGTPVAPGEHRVACDRLTPSRGPVANTVILRFGLAGQPSYGFTVARADGHSTTVGQVILPNGQVMPAQGSCVFDETNVAMFICQARFAGNQTVSARFTITGMV